MTIGDRIRIKEAIIQYQPILNSTTIDQSLSVQIQSLSLSSNLHLSDSGADPNFSSNANFLSCIQIDDIDDTDNSHISSSTQKSSSKSNTASLNTIIENQQIDREECCYLTESQKSDK